MAYRFELKKAILSRGIKQRWIADQLEVDPSRVTNWVTGRAQPDEETRHRLAEILGCEVDEIFPGE